MENLDRVADFLFEAGMLAKTPRSGFAFLGSGKQSVAEHLHRAACIGYALGHIAGDVDTGKIVQICMFHDFTEARISDLNYTHQRYVTRNEAAALEDAVRGTPFAESMKELLDEYHVRESKESKLAKDADNLELLLSIKELMDVGNTRAQTWIPATLSRLLTDEGKALAETILKTGSDSWWFKDKDGDWWVNRKIRPVS